MNITNLTAYLDDLLRIAEIRDYPNAYNGLQLENAGRVTRVVAAVDACEAVIRKAVELRADLLVVHHGLYWNKTLPITGMIYRKLKLAMDHNLAIYSAHLPLDVHGEFGNNVLLAKEIGMPQPVPFLEIDGLDAGLCSNWLISREELLERLQSALGGGRVHVAPGGPNVCRRVGVVTGGAGSEVARAARYGVDTFITGEGPHWSFPLAEELGVNLFYAGHYATETFGVKALAAHLKERFGLPWEFVDHPTGL